jgi:large subunit ribosomal protein L35
MPKMKTNSSAKKRFKVTGSGKLKRSRSGKKHLLRKKSKKAKLLLTHPTIVSKADEKKMKELLCM